MGKIVVIFLCVFITVFGSTVNRTEDPFHMHERIEGLKKMHRDFIEVGASLAEFTNSFDPFNKPGKPTTENPVLRSITSCSDAMEKLPSPHSGKQKIYPYGKENSTSMEVLCDFDVDKGGWTIIQKRSSGPKYQFDRNWDEYARGFGSLDGNFWLGLDNIHILTRNGDQELRIDLEDFEGEKVYAKYLSFWISDASDGYRLSLSGYSEDSTAGDSMTSAYFDIEYLLNGNQFSTKDRDNAHELEGLNCAGGGLGGWWYGDGCSISWLNGLYMEKEETGSGTSTSRWKTWIVDKLAKIEMKIRKRAREIDH